MRKSGPSTEEAEKVFEVVCWKSRGNHLAVAEQWDATTFVNSWFTSHLLSSNVGLPDFNGAPKLM